VWQRATLSHPPNQSHKMEGVLGPLERPVIMDEFTFSQVKGAECLGQVCRKVCKALKRSLGKDKRKFLCVCVPCYNESTDDLMKTIASLMENVDFMKHKTRFNDDEVGTALRDDFESLQIVIVPIFDGFKAMDSTVKEWLASDFPGSLDGMDVESAPELVHVRVCSARWWYYCWDTLRKESNEEPEGPKSEMVRNFQPSDPQPDIEESTRERVLSTASAAESYIHFQLIPIIKKTNHRKHNSHHWFFQGICVGLNASLVFLTDCGTTYHETCVARLVYALRTRRDLIGVTARQRVETPNPNFHPCEKTKLPFLHGEHEGIGSHPCWKCHLSYLLSAAPLQGFEFEATLILNSALFNLVEAMPVLPGPCQLLDWPRMRKYRVVEEYFDLLFNEDTVVTGSEAVRDRTLPQGYLNSNIPRGRMGMSRTSSNNSFSESVRSQSFTGSVSTTTSTGDSFSLDRDIIKSRIPYQQSNPILRNSSPNARVASTPIPEFPEEDDDEINELHMRSSVSAVPRLTQVDLENNQKEKPTGPILTFTEFLRVNMRLAEDRVLSFVTVFSTGFGTKWIPGATFYYEPEVTFQSLLTQR
jgi:cellulose synthase/poly-beta-1,6-N-acetylglucosamine synthase-like glycosyltransferase